MAKSKAEARLTKALASARRRTSKLRKEIKSEPITDSLSVVAGGAAAGAVGAYLPANLQTIGGLPFPAVAGLGLVIYASMGKKNTKLASQLGSGMLAVVAAKLTSDALA